jgi:hypothetical protein
MLSVSVMDKVTGALTFAPFLRIWNGGPYLTVLSTTFQVACWTTVLCLVLGYPLAYWLSQKPAHQQRIATLFVLLPFWTSALIKNFSWLVLLGRNGIVAKTMAAIGLKGGDQLRRQRRARILAGILPTLGTRRRFGRPPCSCCFARLLHHAGARRRRQGHHDRAAYHPADQRAAELAARQRTCGDSPDRDHHDLLRL